LEQKRDERPYRKGHLLLFFKFASEYSALVRVLLIYQCQMSLHRQTLLEKIEMMRPSQATEEYLPSLKTATSDRLSEKS